MTAGLSSAPACIRVIVRDVAGKHSWDSAVLYGPPPCSPSSPAHSLLSHIQATHPASLHLRTPSGGLPKRMEVNMEDDEEGGQEEDGEDFREEEEDRKVVEMEKGDHRRDEAEEGLHGEDKKEQGENDEVDKSEPGLEQLLAPPLAKRMCREAMPAWDSLREGDDALDEMLQYLGYSSPECLQRAGTHMNCF